VAVARGSDYWPGGNIIFRHPVKSLTLTSPPCKSPTVGEPRPALEQPYPRAG
jgi:hypothetical protein